MLDDLGEAPGRLRRFVGYDEREVERARLDLEDHRGAATGRLVLALVNEGAYILEEGIASKASDIDMVYLTGYGFPLFRGGPMLYADVLGLDKVVEQMAAYAKNPQDDASFWKPAPVLATLAAEGKTFNA